MGCAAAIANLNVFDSGRVLEKSTEKIKFLEDRLNQLNNLKYVGDIRNKGFMVGIELVKDRSNKESFPNTMRVGTKVGVVAREKGLIIRPLGDVIVLMPPFSASLDELDMMVRIIGDSIRDVTERSCLC